MRKVFLEDLPRWGKKGHGNEGTINWNKSIGCKIRFVYEDIEGWLEIVDYNKDKQCLEIKYLDEPIFKIQTGKLPECNLGKILGRHTSDFKIEISKNFKDNKRDMEITDREYRIMYDKNNKKHNYKWYKYTCNVCGWTEGWIVESNLKQGNGCGCCCASPQILVENINSIVAKEETQWMIPYFQGGYDEAKKYTKSSNQRIYPKCPDCGRIKDKPIAINAIHKTQSISCTCSDKISYPNKFSYSLLDQLNEIYKFEYLEHEYSPEWIKPKRYDNYFIHNGKEYILEMDGAWHNKDNTLSGQTKEESISIDNKKDLKAKEHGIEVIRVDCEKSNLEFIKQDIIIKLNMFDMNKINWLKCEEYALSNLCKQACDYKRNNTDMTTVEIGEIMKLSSATIWKYLKKGHKLGWCYYNGKVEQSKARTKLNKKGKRVEIFKGGISFGEFPSCMELERQSEELFEMKLDNRKVSAVCTGRRPQHKGFTFKYINEIEQAI